MKLEVEFAKDDAAFIQLRFFIWLPIKAQVVNDCCSLWGGMFLAKGNFKLGGKMIFMSYVIKSPSPNACNEKLMDVS